MVLHQVFGTMGSVVQFTTSNSCQESTNQPFDIQQRKHYNLLCIHKFYKQNIALLLSYSLSGTHTANFS